MLMMVVIFIIFLGPLIFFHELGHFLFARLFGVRVEVFSLGFGPKIFRYKKGETEYAISIIPLGGYVKMFGDDPLNKDQIPEEQKKYSYNHKSVWARFWIVLGGPLANFILAYFIFFALLLNGERLPEIRVGVLSENQPLYSIGLRSGDILKKVNDRVIEGPSDLEFVAEKQIVSIELERDGKIISVPVNQHGQEFLEKFFSLSPALRKPYVVDAKKNTYYLSPSKESSEKNISLEEISQRENLSDLYLFKLKSKEEDVLSFNESTPQIFKISANGPNEFFKALFKNGFYPLDLVVKSISMGSPADKASFKEGDIIWGLNEQNMKSFEEIRSSLQEIQKENVTVDYLQGGVSKRISLVPKIEEQDGKKVKLLGIYSSGIYLPPTFAHTKSKGIFKSFGIAFERTWESFVKTMVGFKKLVMREVSFKNLGGPLAIGKVASDSFHISLSYFFQLMALISVNLAIINLFPIPVLDGGHIMFMILEVINRGPLSRRKMEIAQQVGLSSLLLLMFVALFNDFARYF